MYHDYSSNFARRNCAFFSDAVPVHRVVRAVEFKMATMECHQCQNVIFYFRLTSPIFVNKFCLIVVFFCLFRYRHFIRIQTFYSDTDILFGYRHFIRIQTFYSKRTFHSDTDILFGYRHFIRIQTFYSDTDILLGYRHFIRIQTFSSDTNILISVSTFSKRNFLSTVQISLFFAKFI